jgi:hypothetical protein
MKTLLAMVLVLSARVALCQDINSAEGRIADDEAMQNTQRLIAFQDSVRSFRIDQATKDQQDKLQDLHGTLDPKIDATQKTIKDLSDKRTAALKRALNGDSGPVGRNDPRTAGINKRFSPQIEAKAKDLARLQKSEQDQIDAIVGTGLKPSEYKTYEKFTHMTKAQRIEFEMNMPEN